MDKATFLAVIDRLFIFFACIVYMAISPAVVHVTIISDQDHHTGTCSSILIPVEMMVCFVYTILVYCMVMSENMLIKSCGYGVAVSPILAYAEIESF